jgi:hypothetical protein
LEVHNINENGVSPERDDGFESMMKDYCSVIILRQEKPGIGFTKVQTVVLPGKGFLAVKINL